MTYEIFDPVNLGVRRVGEMVNIRSASLSLHAMVRVMGISITEVAAEVGLTKTRIAQFMSGKPVPHKRRVRFVKMLKDILAGYRRGVGNIPLSHADLAPFIEAHIAFAEALLKTDETDIKATFGGSKDD